MNLDLCALRWTHLDACHGIADEQSVKDRTDKLRLLCRRDRRYPPFLHAFRCDGRYGALHARTHNGWNRLIAHDNSRSLLHAGVLCGICGGKEPPSCKKEKNGSPHAHRRADPPHQNVPPTRKCTRPPCEPRP